LRDKELVLIGYPIPLVVIKPISANITVRTEQEIKITKCNF